MDLVELKKLKRKASMMAESFRGVDMDGYVAMNRAANQIDTAMTACKKLKKRKSPTGLSLKTLLSLGLQS